MSLRRRLLLSYGLVLMLVAAVLGVALVRLRALTMTSEIALRDNVRSVLYGERMIDALERMDSAVLLRMAGEGPAAIAQFDSARVAFEGHLADEQANLTVTGEAETAARVADDFAHFLQLVGRSDAPVADLQRYRQVLLPAFFAVRQGAARIRDLNLVAMRSASDRAQRRGKAAFWATLGIGLLALTVGAVTALLLSSSLARPLRRVTEAAERIGRGDLDVRIAEDAPGELADLARTMNGMAQQLRDVRALNVQQLVSEKRKVEAVLQALDDGVVVVDDALRIAAFNPAAERALGPQRLGLPLDEAISERALAQAVRTAIRSGHDHADPAIIPMPALGNHARHYQAVVSVLAGPFGGTAAVVLLRDLTEMRAVERMKSNFIMAASHELRTPLTGLEMSLGMLGQSTLSDADQELVDVAAQESARLTQLVSELLELASAEAGQTRLTMERVGPDELIRDVCTRFTAQAEAKGITLHVEKTEGTPEVDADAVRIGLALSNFVANAIRHAHSVVQLRVTTDVQGITFAVEDDGPGIPLSEGQRLFEPFFQLDNGKPGGAGLGLTLVREIAELHGGRVGVREAVAGGACFWLTLPRSVES